MNVLAELDLNVNDNNVIVKPASTKSRNSRTSRISRSSRRSSSTMSTSTNHRIKSSFILESDDDEDEDYDTAMKGKSRPSRICFDDDSDDESEDEDDGYLSPLQVDGTTTSTPRGSGGSTTRTAKGRKSRSSSRPPSFEKRKSHPDSHKKVRKTPNPKPRKRRRSSARFLRLSGRFDNNNHSNDNSNDTENDHHLNDEHEEPEKLGEMYRQAIRLNAENKINVGNSWGLKLIENIDKFLGDDDEEEEQVKDMDAQQRTVVSKEQGGEKRVNFTKASCTLDASVKIYSYRVDDVHLTSYKVLANLNRTDGGGGTKKSNLSKNNLNGHDSDNDDDLDGSGGKSRKSTIGRSGRRNVVDTIESNPANINISKLDAAYDIDPLFHKLSQKFDEGGAKGLLLVNLGVAHDGCRIILDSKEDSVVKDVEVNAVNNDNVPTLQDDDDIEEMVNEANDTVEDKETSSESTICNEHSDEGMVDIFGLSNKLQELLLCSPLDSTLLVPQLEEMRMAYQALEEEGFSADAKNSNPKSKCYANDEEDEKAAEEVIHQEALERSRYSMGVNASRISMGVNASRISMGVNASCISMGLTKNAQHSQLGIMGGVNNTFISSTSAEKQNESHYVTDPISEIEPQYAPDDYDCGDDGYDDSHGDGFEDLGEEGASGEFNDMQFGNEDIDGAHVTSNGGNTTVHLLDALCESDALTQGGEYGYFNAAALEKITAGDQWMGSAHWKRSDRLRKKEIARKERTEQDKENAKGKRVQKRKVRMQEDARSSIQISSTGHECIDALLGKSVSGRKGKSDPTVLTKAARHKLAKDRNILSSDAGVHINHLTKLFMRPNTVTSATSGNKVGFGNTTDGYAADHYDDIGDDGSYMDGPGFELPDNTDPIGNGNFVESDDYVVQEIEGVRKVEKLRVNHAKVAKRVDVKRLKKELWAEVECKTASEMNAQISLSEEQPITDPDNKESLDNEGLNSKCEQFEDEELDDGKLSFKETVFKMEATEAQEDVSLAFYFICMLHLANEKGLKLENGEHGLNDFVISKDDTI